MSFESRFSSMCSPKQINLSGTLVRTTSVKTSGIDLADSDFADGVSSHSPQRCVAWLEFIFP